MGQTHDIDRVKSYTRALENQYFSLITHKEKEIEQRKNYKKLSVLIIE